MQSYKLILGLILGSFAFGALPSNNTGTWETRNNGNDTNGGAFVAGSSGTDYSTNDNKNASGCSNCGSSSVNLSTTDAVANGTTTITSATANFSSAIVGNIVYFQGGTGSITAQWRHVTTFTNSTTIVIDASIATSTGMTMNIGGALKTLAQLNTNLGLATRQRAWVKNDGTYSISAAVSFNLGVPGATPYLSFISGYTTTRGDGGRPTIQASGTMATNMIRLASPWWTFENFIIDGNSLACPFEVGTGNQQAILARHIEAKNWGSACTGGTGGAIFFVSFGGVCFDCYAHTGTGGPAINFNGGWNNLCVNCKASDVTTYPGFSFNGGNSCINCISNDISGTSADCLIVAAVNAPTMIYGFSAYNCGRDGIRVSNGPAAISVINSVIYTVGVSATGYALNNAVSGTFDQAAVNFDYNAYESGSINGITAGANDQTLTANPYTNTGTQDFTLNSTAGGGAVARNTGFPGALISGGTGGTSMGAIQPTAAAASTGSAIGYVQ